MTEISNMSHDQQSLFRDENQIIKDLESEKQESIKKLDVLYRMRDETCPEIKTLQLNIISFYK